MVTEKVIPDCKQPRVEARNRVSINETYSQFYLKLQILKTFTVWLVLCSVSCDYYKNWSVQIFCQNVFWISYLSAFKNYKILKGHENIREADFQVLWRCIVWTIR